MVTRFIVQLVVSIRQRFHAWNDRNTTRRKQRSLVRYVSISLSMFTDISDDRRCWISWYKMTTEKNDHYLHQHCYEMIVEYALSSQHLLSTDVSLQNRTFSKLMLWSYLSNFHSCCYEGFIRPKWYVWSTILIVQANDDDCLINGFPTLFLLRNLIVFDSLRIFVFRRLTGSIFLSVSNDWHLTVELL